MFEPPPSRPQGGAGRAPGTARFGSAQPDLGDRRLAADAVLPPEAYVPFPASSATVAVDDGDGEDSVTSDGDVGLPSGRPAPKGDPVVRTGPVAAPQPESPGPIGAEPVVVRPTLDTSRSVLGELAQPLVLVVVAPALGAVMGIMFLTAESRLVVPAIASVVAGVIVGAAEAVRVVRRIHRDVDAPVTVLRTTLSRISHGDVEAHVPATRNGPLRPLLDEFDGAFEVVGRRMDRLRRKAEWGDQSRMIFEALELAEDEPEAYRVMSDALALVDPMQSVELMMAPPGSQRLRVMANNPVAKPPGCMVESLAGCVAVGRGQVVAAESSESINACPLLRGRPVGPVSAACVPVTVSGHPVGVFHAAGPDRHPPDAGLVERLSSVGAQLGTRIGALRMLESSREEAATDGLTGLPNRRVLESQLADLFEAEIAFVMVLADLDKFKGLNDTYGHEAGDRALQLFARVLQDNIRGQDLVARVGGEEFVVVYPDMSVPRSVEAIERIRQALGAAIAMGSVQPFTCSFGFTHSAVGTSAQEILRVADAGLLRAKDLGGDLLVYADEGLMAEVFGDSNRRGRLDVRLD